MKRSRGDKENRMMGKDQSQGATDITKTRNKRELIITVI